ncbi:MAG: MBOAT family protein [Clostridiaceae bacterium]|nr:MBOAT family protein [Clostridiaceae bacterium]
MVFSSMFFLFLFLMATIAVYFLVPQRQRRMRNLVLLGASLFFYFFGEPLGILLMLASIVGNYCFARAIAAGRRARLWLTLSVVFNLLLLGTFKYADFFVANLNALTGLSLPQPGLAMPIGISFFTFQGMSYVFDVYARRVPAQRSILNVAAYISMFPQLVAGPIVRYETVAAELDCRRETLSRAAEGARRFVYGLSKKMLLSNAMGKIAAAVFAENPAGLAAPMAWVGALAYTFQIFFDFSGYSDMAIGLGRMFGFHFLENFDYPYLSKSVAGFWRRWHISLCTWFRDYVYFPLGGSRVKLPRLLFNMCVVWTLTGLWHGAEWTYVLWGFNFFLIQAIERLTGLGKWMEKHPVGHLYGMFRVVVLTVMIRCDSLSGAALYYGTMFGLSGAPLVNDLTGVYIREYGWFVAAAVIFGLPIARWFKDRTRMPDSAAMVVRTAFVLCVTALSLSYAVMGGYNPFIYFNF